MSVRRFLAASSLLVCASACAELHQGPPAPAAPVLTADQMLNSLADRMIAEQVAYDPTSAYFIGVPPPDNRRWPDHSLEAIAAFRAQRAALLAELQRINPADLSQPKRFIHASMVERLESERQIARACRYELWDANHLSGWHMEFADVAREQPVETAEQRAAALERWSNLPSVVDQEIANARVGLQSGYSAPKPVVRRLIKQIETIASSKPESLPYDQIATRSTDPEFQAAFRDIIATQVQPAFRRYEQFLKDEYLPRVSAAGSRGDRDHGQSERPRLL